MMRSRPVSRVTRIRNGADDPAFRTLTRDPSLWLTISVRPRGGAGFEGSILRSSNVSFELFCAAELASEEEDMGWKRAECSTNLGLVGSYATTTFSPPVVISKSLGANEKGSRMQPWEAG